MKHLQTVQYVPNAVIATTDLALHQQGENLLSIDLSSVNFMNGFALQHLYLGNCQELSTLLLTATTGLVVLADTPSVPAVPKDWAGLTKISSLNFQSAGLSEQSVGNLIKGLSQRANEGMGGAVLTAKTITLNGTNARPLLTDATIASAKANLIAKGWTVTHN